MTSFESLTILNDNLVKYFTGSYAILAILICIIFFIVLLTYLDVRYALTFTIPLLAFFTVIGWFGTVTNNQWIINLGLIAVSVIYGIAILKLAS